ncbi:uncharacterized protein LOC110843786 isoform X2 [Folsomia candida]|uniref:uncharacterized protein LOC110843786 isoform X2 n=1 Tax=Folsomia candida TaxID=158441 RepID=UPI001605109D|nr:uncharacterized protein LOC110843786 isoform X2 [Folsomia candida]
MYGGGFNNNGGSGSEWNPWIGGGMQQGAQKQNQRQPVATPQNQFQLQQGQQQQIQTNLMGYAGYGVQTPSTYSAGMVNPNNNMNQQQSPMMGMVGNSAWANANANLMNINPYMNNNNNAFFQQQNAFMQQQQIQQQNQPLFQTNVGYPRPNPQPPLPPGPPPEDLKPRNSFYGEITPHQLQLQPPLPTAVPPSLPVNPPTPAAPPPPLPPQPTSQATSSKFNQNFSSAATTASSTTSSNTIATPAAGKQSQHNSDPQIPDVVLKLLQNAETARQFQQATETLSKVNPLMALNVSQDLFGSSSQNNKGIPGLDFMDDDKTKKSPNPNAPSDEIETVTLDSPQGQSDNLSNNVDNRNQSTGWTTQGGVVWNSNNNKKTDDGIKWELRDEIKQQITCSTAISSTESTLQTSCPESGTKKQDKDNFKDNFQIGSDTSGTSKSDSSSNQQTASFSAKIPLAPKDGKPVEYDRRTLKVFDKKFRDWEKQFENWKTSNLNHPDHDAYNKYMDQWNLWREQLIEQRRFIIDSMNKARLEVSSMSENMNLEDLLKSRPKEESSKDGTPAVQNKTNVPPPPPSTMPNKTTAPPPRFSDSRSDSSSSYDFATQSHPNFKASNFESQQRIANMSHATKADGLNTCNDQFSNRSGPVPLMSLQPNIPPTENKSGVLPISGSRNERDRPVERIPRDRDRSAIGHLAAEGKNKKPPQPSVSNQPSDRVSRDPQDHKPEANPFAFDQVSWEMPNKSKTGNPFEVTPKQDNNPFDIGQSDKNPFSTDNQFSWGSKLSEAQTPAKLPTLSDFLSKDDCKVTDDYLNRRGFGTATKPEIQNTQTFDVPTTSRLEFTATSKLLPLVVASKPKDPSPPPLSPHAHTGPESVQQQTRGISEWFTRDRGGAVEEEEELTNNNDDYYHEGDDFSDSNNTPAVIDYGHGTGSRDVEDDEYDLPRCERPVADGDYSNFDDIPSNSDVIDYGHGSVAPKGPMGIDPSVYNDHLDYSEGNHHQRESRENYRATHPSNTFRGGRGGPIRARGQGRGRGTNFGRPQYASSEMQYPPYNNTTDFIGDDSYGDYNREDYGHPSDHHIPDKRELPFANRGKGRGFAARFGPPETFDSPDIGRPNAVHSHFRQKSYNPVYSEETDDVIILDSSPPREITRLAPSRDTLTDRRPANSRRDDQNQDIRNSRPDERYRDTTTDRVRRDPEDERRQPDRDKYSKGYDRGRPRQDIGSKRDRIESSNETDKRIRRSPLLDKVPVFRNHPGSHAGGKSAEHLPASNPPPPRYQTIDILDILNQPGRAKRPSQIVVILRGLPGSGKSYIAKLIKDKEVELGESAPRILSIDDYFMQETEKIVKDPVTRADVTKIVMEYEYEADLEPKYRSDLIKTFKKNVENGYFPFIIVDGVNDQVRHFDDMVSFATQRKFQVYIAEVEESVESCVTRNIHHRNRDDILKIHKSWERCPSNFVKLDVRTLLQDDAIQDVEMEDVSDTEIVEPNVEKPKEETTDPVKDKWETAINSDKVHSSQICHKSILLLFRTEWRMETNTSVATNL